MNPTENDLERFKLDRLAELHQTPLTADEIGSLSGEAALVEPNVWFGNRLRRWWAAYSKELLRRIESLRSRAYINLEARELLEAMTLHSVEELASAIDRDAEDLRELAGEHRDIAASFERRLTLQRRPD